MSILETLDAEYLADSDFVMSYMLEHGTIAGRFVRLGPLAQDIVSRHDVPPSVGLLLAEFMAAAAAMASSLKFTGILTFQTKSNGPISRIVTDVTTTGHIRATCTIDRFRLSTLGKAPSFGALVGKGYIAVTIDQGPDMERYQGVVDLVGTKFADTLEHYFKQSNQQDMVIKLASVKADQGYQAAAISAQRVAYEGGTEIGEDEVKEAWRRSVILLSTATADEMLAPSLQPAELLYRLFHEDGVVVQKPQTLQHKCRCSSERVEEVLKALSADELKDCQNDAGIIESVCEFCRTAYRFTVDADGKVVTA